MENKNKLGANAQKGQEVKEVTQKQAGAVNHEGDRKASAGSDDRTNKAASDKKSSSNR